MQFTIIFTIVFFIPHLSTQSPLLSSKFLGKLIVNLLTCRYVHIYIWLTYWKARFMSVDLCSISRNIRSRHTKVKAFHQMPKGAPLDICRSHHLQRASHPFLPSSSSSHCNPFKLWLMWQRLGLVQLPIVLHFQYFWGFYPLVHTYFFKKCTIEWILKNEPLKIYKY